MGTEYVKHQQYEPAVIALAKALEINPRAQASLFAIAVGQYHLKQLPAALESLRSCVSLNPRSINTQLWLGIVLKATGKLDEAETSFKKANELAESKVPEPHWQLALLFNQLKRYNEKQDEKLIQDQFVKIEIVTGLDRNAVVDVVEARNTSNAVKQTSLEELRGTFKELQAAANGDEIPQPEMIDRVPRMLQAPELTDGLPFGDTTLETEEVERV